MEGRGSLGVHRPRKEGIDIRFRVVLFRRGIALCEVRCLMRRCHGGFAWGGRGV